MENCYVWSSKSVWQIVEQDQNDAQPLYIIDSAYFPITESVHLSEAEDQVDGTEFAGITDQEEQGGG